MADPTALDRDYLTTFLRYLSRREEVALAKAYDLGREAVTSGVSVLELARVHHKVLMDVLDETRPEEVRDVASAASEFFMEVLATFDMTQRSLLDDG